MIEGVKHDAGKPRHSLLPMGVLSHVIDVLEFGAKKYGDHNWVHVTMERGRAAYYDAAMRHLEAWWQGESEDPESGLPHLAHAICCLMFLQWHEDNGQ